MSSFGTTMQGHCEYVHVKIEQPICKSTATNSKNKREYKLLFKPVQITNEEKIKLLTDLLDNVEEKFEKINYLTDRVEIYYECDEWTNVLKDIAEIESLGATKLSERLLTMKTEANIHMGISTVRRSIIDAVVNGVEKRYEFQNLLEHLNHEVLTQILNGKKMDNDRRSTKRKRCFN
ncbi:unnamed protein product [Rotaria magnacalcarata]|uniref:Uncharacterized protein n=1 Tax=Rotaria magnacalcarata TaxID=392030 RepID=A0A816BBN8_9BILA|nr:unnamed protein product [Rotaria magnacalcarata]CAF2028652.1 unnamed protein product [Rotaria magnacalcarata]